jgi:general secretion pathway protein D
MFDFHPRTRQGSKMPISLVPARAFRFVGAVALACAILAARPSIAGAAQLMSISSQPLPNGHTRVLVQFDRGVVVRVVPNVPSNTVILQAPASMSAPGLPNFFPLNTGNVQNVSVSFGNGGLQITILLFSAAHPTLTVAASNLYVVDVPQGASNSYPPYNQGANNQPGPVAQPFGTQFTRMYRLHYADVAEVAGLLGQNISIAPGNAFNPQPNQFGQFGNTTQFQNAGQLGTYQNGTFGQYAGGLNGLQPTFGGFQNQYNGLAEGAQGQRINENLAVDRRLNAIIVTGTPQQIAQAEELIKLVDVPLQSVLIDTQVLEITDTGEKALGLNWGQTPTNPITHIFNTQAQILNGLPANAIPGAIPLMTDIFLLVSKGQARVLASPKILTEDGLPASIVTGDSLPIRITTPVGVGGVGAVTSQVEYVNVGVNLQILPRITDVHGIETDIFSQVSSVTSFSSSGDPQISSRQAQTRVNMVEGQTLIIGGLLQSRDIHNLQKIPVIGDLPLIGALFRFYTETRQNTNLVIMITPHIIAAPQQTPPVVPTMQP